MATNCPICKKGTITNNSTHYICDNCHYHVPIKKEQQPKTMFELTDIVDVGSGYSGTDDSCYCD